MAWTTVRKAGGGDATDALDEVVGLEARLEVGRECRDGVGHDAVVALFEDVTS